MDSTFSLDTPTATSAGAVPAPVTTQDTKEVRLVDVAVTDGTVALNLMASFLNVAQRRGTFSIDESAKIWECLKLFTAPTGTA
jgi:predicted transcriptional regulator